MPHGFWSREPGSELRVLGDGCLRPFRIRRRNIGSRGLVRPEHPIPGRKASTMNDRVTTGPRVIAAAVALLGVAALTLGPRAIVAPARGSFLRATEAVAAPVSALLPHASVDQILNALLFVPLGAALALLLPRRLWWVAIGGGLALSATVEYVQASIPGRVPDVDDVLWNTVGTTIGVLAMTLVGLAVGAAGHLLRRSVRPSRARR